MTGPSSGGPEGTQSGTKRPQAIPRRPSPMSGGHRHRDLSAAEILSITHMTALLLVVLSAVLFKHSNTGPESGTPWLFLAQGALVAFIGRRICRSKLITLARGRGLSETDAKAHAKAQMLRLSEPWRRSSAARVPGSVRAGRTVPGQPRRAGEGSRRSGQGL